MSRKVRMKALSLFLIAVTSGCTTTPNPKSCADDFCNDPALPFCDADGSISGTPNTCVAVECTANEFVGCRGDELLTCNATGTDYNVSPCEFGCNEGAEACNACVPGTVDCEPHIIPMHMTEVCNSLAALPARTFSSSTMLNTDDDNVCTGGVVDQTLGPDVCVLRHKSIDIENGVTVTVTGTRAIALVADDELTIAGVFDVSANGITNGPGGGVFKSGGNVGTVDDGAGGAGFKTAGAAGGNAATHGGANNGGPISPNPALMVELVGGAQNTKINEYRPDGGGGGGAANLISCRATVAILGLIDAGGGGGAAGYSADGANFGAAGGGSGGYLVVQGMMVNVTGEVYANGGGGGASRYSPLPQDAGNDGTRSATVSAAGGAGYLGMQAGGIGGRQGTAPGVGVKTTDPASYGPAGAGGGSTGYLQSYTPSGVLPIFDPRGVSPIFEPNATVQTR